jgi:hypothetical protein
VSSQSLGAQQSPLLSLCCGKVRSADWDQRRHGALGLCTWTPQSSRLLFPSPPWFHRADVRGLSRAELWDGGTWILVSPHGGKLPGNVVWPLWPGAHKLASCLNEYCFWFFFPLCFTIEILSFVITAR